MYSESLLQGRAGSVMRATGILDEKAVKRYALTPAKPWTVVK
jgi:hypothetical protein